MFTSEVRSSLTSEIGLGKISKCSAVVIWRRNGCSRAQEQGSDGDGIWVQDTQANVNACTLACWTLRVHTCMVLREPAVCKTYGRETTQTDCACIRSQHLGHTCVCTCMHAWVRKSVLAPGVRMDEWCMRVKLFYSFFFIPSTHSLLALGSVQSGARIDLINATLSIFFAVEYIRHLLSPALTRKLKCKITGSVNAKHKSAQLSTIKACC